MKNMANEFKGNPQKQKLIEEEIQRVVEQWQLHEQQIKKEVYHLELSSEQALDLEDLIK